ncbi:MAG: hypothetical protein WEA10_10440 [Actinomycetota bacterium]
MRAHSGITVGTRRWSRILAAAVFLAIAAPAPALLSTTVACASTPRHAALVIDTGTRELAYCVAIPGTVDGIELIRLANRQYGLQYSLGFGGEAVCQLAGVGVTGGDCFADFPRFWGYWRGAPAGGWSWSSVGAGSISVGPGDVQGWSWGTGQDGASHPAPPVTPLTSVCDPPATPPPDDDGGPGAGAGGDGNDRGNNGGGGGGAPSGSASDQSSGDTQAGAQSSGASDAGGQRSDQENGSEREASGSHPDTSDMNPVPDEVASPGSNAAPVRAAALANNEAGADLLPVGPIVSLLALGMLLAGGAFLAWKRRSG